MTVNRGQSDPYQTHAHAGWVVYAHRDYPRSIANLSVSVPESVTLQPVEASPYARVFTGTVEAEGTTYAVYVKTYLFRSAIDRLKHWVRPGRARRNHTASTLLTRYGFLCPVVVATACHRPWLASVPGLRDLPYCRASSTVTLAVTDAIALDLYYNEIKGRVERRRFLQTLGREIGRLHGHGIFHGDLRVGNVLVQEEGDTWRFWLLDNERTVQFGVLPERRRVKNLVQIHLFVKNLTDSDRWRFFKTYCQAAGIDKSQQVSLIHLVRERTAQREASRARRML